MFIIVLMILTIPNLRWKWCWVRQSSKIFVFVFGNNSFECNMYCPNV